MKVRPTQPPLRTSSVPGVVEASVIEGVLLRGQVLERREQRNEARALYENALRDGTAATAADMVQLHWLIARTFMEDGDLAAAEDSATAALAISRQTQDEAGEGRAINTLAAIQWNQGEHEEARELISRHT